MKRTDNLSDEVKDLQRNLISFKSTQTITGDSWRVYRNQTSDDWDIIVPDSSPGFSQLYEIELTQSVTVTPNAYMILLVKDETNPGMITSNAFMSHDNPLKFYIYIATSVNGWQPGNGAKVKFYGYSPVRGTLTIQAV